MENTEEYEKIKSNLLRKKSDLEDTLQRLAEKYETMEKSDVSQKEKRLEIERKSIARKRNALIQIEEQLELLRPANQQDKEYRSRQYYEFPSKIEKVVPDNLPLRFHGCPITAAKHILESGELSSSVDRLGYETSYDVEDQVSVTTKNTIDTTVRGYTHLNGSQCLPAGCIFVLLPKDEEDAKAGESMLMGNVNFKSEPDRLYGIITTPENLERINTWAQEYGIDLTDKLYDFDGFTRSFEKEQSMDEEDRMIGSAIEATEEMTRSGKINEQVQNMKNIQKSKEEQNLTTDEMDK